MKDANNLDNSLYNGKSIYTSMTPLMFYISDKSGAIIRDNNKIQNMEKVMVDLSFFLYKGFVSHER